MLAAGDAERAAESPGDPGGAAVAARAARARRSRSCGEAVAALDARPSVVREGVRAQHAGRLPRSAATSRRRRSSSLARRWRSPTSSGSTTSGGRAEHDRGRPRRPPATAPGSTTSSAASRSPRSRTRRRASAVTSTSGAWQANFGDLRRAAELHEQGHRLAERFGDAAWSECFEAERLYQPYWSRDWETRPVAGRPARRPGRSAGRRAGPSWTRASSVAGSRSSDGDVGSPSPRRSGRSRSAAPPAIPQNLYPALALHARGARRRRDAPTKRRRTPTSCSA